MRLSRAIVAMVILFVLVAFAGVAAAQTQWPATDGSTAVALYELPTMSSTPQAIPYGAELAVNSAAGWDDAGAWATVGTTTTRTASGADLVLTNTGAPTAGLTYRVTITYGAITAGSFTPSLGGATGATRTTAGTYSEDLVAVSTTAIKITAVAASAGTITAISVKPVQGVVIPAWANRVLMEVRDGDVMFAYNLTPTATIGIKVTAGEKIVWPFYDMMLFRSIQWYGLESDSKVSLLYSRASKEQ